MTKKHVVKEGNISVLDLGCGTGLVGQELRNPVYLVGVDVSLKMIKQNFGKKSRYDELICSEIIDFLENEKRKFDFICISSVIQFFPPSRVDNLMQNISAKLKNDGVFIFTFDVTRFGSKINSKGFFTHSTDFMKDLSSRYFDKIQIENLKFGRLERQKRYYAQWPYCQMSALEDLIEL